MEVRRYLAELSRELTMLRSYDRSIFGVQLGAKPATPCETGSLRKYRKQVKELTAQLPVRERSNRSRLVVIRLCMDRTCAADGHVVIGTVSDLQRHSNLLRQTCGSIALRIAELEAEVQKLAEAYLCDQSRSS